MLPVVFVGPSVDAKAVHEAGQVEVLPPVRRGDVEALFRRPTPPDRVGIVDGVFLQGLAISPKEILAVIEHREVAFYGSSSIGALRAVELADYGMTGVGRIFEMYAGGEVDADDEVAITFDPETLVALSEPMVNIRVAVEAAVDRGLLSGATATVVLDTAKRLYFPDRTYRNLLRQLAGTALDAAELAGLAAFLKDDPPNAKRDDALELVRLIAG